jgi:hypothetical protein
VNHKTFIGVNRGHGLVLRNPEEADNHLRGGGWIDRTVLEFVEWLHGGANGGDRVFVALQIREDFCEVSLRIT